MKKKIKKRLMKIGYWLIATLGSTAIGIATFITLKNFGII